MIQSLLFSLAGFLLNLSTSLVHGATTIGGTGYEGYNLTQFGDPDSVVYQTADTTPLNISSTTVPDVFLNASVSVDIINITVSNITAKINLDAQVLQLLKFNAGVSASISRVSLVIEKIVAEVLLEARLQNVVLMINDVLHSIDLNPIIATLGQDLGKVINSTVGSVGNLIGAPTHPTKKPRISPRSYDLMHNILYSVNDYTGHTHTNRILAQNGSLIDESLNNEGHIYDEKIVGYYSRDMTFTGGNKTVNINGKVVHELEYQYSPFPGLIVVSLIFTDPDGKVTATKVISEGSAGGSSTVGDGS